MTRRRFFRVLTLTLLLLCLGAWGWGQLWSENLRYRSLQGEISVTLDTVGPAIFVTNVSNWSADTPGKITMDEGWRFTRKRADGEESYRSASGRRFLGFLLYRTILGNDFYQVVRIPLWFPTLLLTALTAWAWRKRRSEGERGFAVGQEQVREESRDKSE